MTDVANRPAPLPPSAPADLTVPPPPVDPTPPVPEPFAPSPEPSTPVTASPPAATESTAPPPSTLPETSPLSQMSPAEPTLPASNVAEPSAATVPSSSVAPSTTSPSAPPAAAPPPQADDFFNPFDEPEQLFLEWQAPNRPFKKRNRQYYTTIAIIVLLICLILFFAGQFLPIAVVIAVAFMAYVLSAVPPETVTNQITTYGIRTDNTLYDWTILGRFWFSTKYQQRLLHVETAKLPGQLTLVVTDLDETEVVEFLSIFLRYEIPPATAFEKAARWLQEKVPLDTEAWYNSSLEKPVAPIV